MARKGHSGSIMNSFQSRHIMLSIGFIFYLLFLPIIGEATSLVHRPSGSIGAQDQTDFENFLHHDGSFDQVQYIGPKLFERSFQPELDHVAVKRPNLVQHEWKESKTQPASSDGLVTFVNTKSIILASSMRVICNTGFMSVVIEKESISNITGQREAMEKISFGGSNDPSCQATMKTSNSTHFILATLYSLCDTAETETNAENGQRMVTMENQVVMQIKQKSSSNMSDNFNDGTGLKFVVNVSCLLETTGESDSNADSYRPNGQAYDNSNHSFMLKLYDRQWTGDDTYSPIRFPFQSPLGQRIYAEIQLDTTITDQDLKAQVIDCFFSQYPDPRLDPRKYVIKAGCPVGKSVLLHHLKSLPVSRFSRFSFELERMYFDTNYLFLHCKAMVCSIGGWRDQEEYRKCPSSRHCGDRNGANDNVSIMRGQSVAVLSIGPIRPYIRETPTSQLGLSCPPCPLSDSSTGIHHHQQERTVLNGISLPCVVGVAFAAFVLGLLFMASIWYIHQRTDPRRYLNPSKGRDEHDSTSCTFSTTATTLTTLKT